MQSKKEEGGGGVFFLGRINPATTWPFWARFSAKAPNLVPIRGHGGAEGHISEAKAAERHQIWGLPQIWCRSVAMEALEGHISEAKAVERHQIWGLPQIWCRSPLPGVQPPAAFFLRRWMRHTQITYKLNGDLSLKSSIH